MDDLNLYAALAAVLGLAGGFITLAKWQRESIDRGKAEAAQLTRIEMTMTRNHELMLQLNKNHELFEERMLESEKWRYVHTPVIKDLVTFKTKQEEINTNTQKLIDRQEQMIKKYMGKEDSDFK